MKKTIISIIVIAILIIGVGLFFLFGRNSTSNQSGGTASSSAGTAGTLPAVSVTSTTSAYNTPTGATLTIGTPKGTIAVNNFYNTAKQISAGRTSVLIAETDTYNITYYTLDSSFNILITETPFATMRAQAEAAFLAALGISQVDACKLNVAVATPYSVDPTDAEQNLGLSFCGAGGAFQAQ